MIGEVPTLLDPDAAIALIFSGNIAGLQQRQHRRDVRETRQLVAEIAEIDAALGVTRSDAQILKDGLELLGPVPGRARHLEAGELFARVRVAAWRERDRVRAQLAKEA